MDDFIQTWGRLRPSVFLLILLLASGVSACGKSESPDLDAQQANNAADPNPWGNADAAEALGLLWDTPPLPNPIEISLDGKVILPEIHNGYLVNHWTSHCAEHSLDASVEELTEGFFEQPEELFTPFLRGVILLQEAEARYPNLVEKDVAHYREQMQAAAGLSFETLRERMGEDGWQRHVERQFRLRLLAEDFVQYAAEVTEEQVMDTYDQDVLSQLATMEAAQGEDVSYATMKDPLRARLEKDAAVNAQEAWIDEQMEAREVKVVLPNGSEHAWQLHTPE
ncbi:MAG: hypothetical protein O3A50_06565 [Planctomycetota bacterium]|nr:hypothetical protein [Planctomycetota bacterium]